MNRPGVRTERNLKRVPGKVGGLCNEIGAAVRWRDGLSGPAHEGVEEAGLRHGLRGAAVAKFGRTVGAQKQQRNGARVGLGHGGKPVRDRTSGGAYQRHGPARRFGGAERGKGGHALIVKGVDLKSEAGSPECKRRRPRAGRDEEV